MKIKNINNSSKRYFSLTLIFIPIIIFFAEVFSFILINRGLINKNEQISHNLVADLISGSDRYFATKKDLDNENAYINKHGLVKTVFISNSDLQKNIKGILIVGNSVAMGIPMPYIGRYKDSFVNRLETEIRKKDDSFDLINLSNYSMNSWQENIELTRYFNSEINHNDLPSNIELIASIGIIKRIANSF